MSRPNPLVLLAIIVVTLGIVASLTLGRGMLLISSHEGDVYHLLDILFRMQEGHLPHADFVTPLGILSVAPIAWLMSNGLGVGSAILASQIIVAAILALPIAYVAWSRLSRWGGYLFAGFTTIMITALSFGGVEPGLSISMHYNRWAWAVAFMMIVIALLQGRGKPLIDGVLLGVGFSALVLIKATFFVALLPGVAVALVMRRETTAIVVAFITGLGAAAVTTALLGTDFWFGYARDLLTVAGSDVRPFPAVPLSELLGHPETLAAIIIAMATYFWASRTGHRDAALGLVLLIPGVFYISYQNFGNDPKWLVPFAAVLLAMRPNPQAKLDNGLNIASAMTATALAACVVYLPSAWTITLSTVRHTAQDVAIYEPMLPAQEAHQDLWVRTDRGNTITAQIHLDQPGSVWADYRADAGRSDPPTLAGLTFPTCELMAGSVAYLKEFTADLDAADVPAGSQIFAADILTAFWLFGPYAPLQGGAPWYYGALSGIENADFVLVPKCTFVGRVSGIMVRELEEADLDLELVRNNELYALFAVR